MLCHAISLALRCSRRGRCSHRIVSWRREAQLSDRFQQYRCDNYRTKHADHAGKKRLFHEVYLCCVVALNDGVNQTVRRYLSWHCRDSTSGRWPKNSESCGRVLIADCAKCAFVYEDVTRRQKRTWWRSRAIILRVTLLRFARMPSLSELAHRTLRHG